MNELAPHSLERLSFATHEEFMAFVSENGEMLKQIWLWHEGLGDREEPLQLPGLCDICGCSTTFAATPAKMPEGDRFNHRVAWWSGLVCGCGMNALNRAVFRAFLDGCREDDRIYHVGYRSAFRHWLSERLPNVVSSQYEEGRNPGEIENGIRYEDLTRLSFSDNEFDCVICLEVLEHISDYKAALREMARTLKPGGRALLSFPWLGGNHYDHLVRAEQLPDGSIRHFHPPEYHQDPDRPEGILSFRSFGWKILDEIRNIGFTTAVARFVFSPLHGQMTLHNPVVVATR